MMRDFKKNMREQKVHTKQTLCIMQQCTERCAVCCKFFRTKDGLRSHLVAHTKSFYRCPLCVEKNNSKRDFTSIKAFKNHLRWHKLYEPLYTCDVCGVQKEWPKNLKSHMQTHQPASKPCRVHPGCEAKFTFDNERNQHERYFDVKKIYTCEPCGTKFKEHLKLELHEARYHNPYSKHYIKSKTNKNTPPTATATSETENIAQGSDSQSTVQQKNKPHQAKKNKSETSETENSAQGSDSQSTVQQKEATSS